MSKRVQLTEDEWGDVQRLMGRCVRHGYVPARFEQRLLTRAWRSNHERYRLMHAAAKDEAAKAVNPLQGDEA